MRSPSGDQSGPRWRPGSATRDRTVAVATSTTETSVCRKELTWGVGAWSKAISLPSGDQANVPTLKLSPPVSRRGSAPSRTSATQRWAMRKSVSSTA